MSFTLIELVTNTQGQEADPKATKFASKESALVNYHNELKIYHNASDVLFAVVEVLDEYGRILGGDHGYREEVDHRPEPEPEPEPETQEG